VQVEEPGGSQLFSSHSQTAGMEQNDSTNNPPLSPLRTKEPETNTDSRSDWEDQMVQKRRRIDRGVSPEQKMGPYDNMCQSMDKSMQDAVDIASVDLPAWWVKVEENQADDKLSHPMEDEDEIDELQDKDISRVLMDVTHNAELSMRVCGLV
jgi:hypothetical protein